MIESIFISHSTGCYGWNMDQIYKDFPLFKNACRTMRFKEKDRNIVKMLDWDYREWLKVPDKVKKRHLELSQTEEFDVIMSMDLWDFNIEESIGFYWKIKENCKRCLIPIHHYCDKIIDLDLAYPNANWFVSNTFPPIEFRNQITHILGGSPQSQIRLITTDQIDLFSNSIRFKQVISLDGNQLFNASIYYGKYWINRKPFWKKPRKEIPNQEIFRRSLENFSIEIEQINKSFF